MKFQKSDHCRVKPSFYKNKENRTPKKRIIGSQRKQNVRFSREIDHRGIARDSRNLGFGLSVSLARVLLGTLSKEDRGPREGRKLRFSPSRACQVEYTRGRYTRAGKRYTSR